MATPYPYPAEPEPRPGPRGIDRPAHLTKRQVQDLCDAVQQRDEQISQLQRDVKMLRERTTKTERELDDLDITLDQYADRLQTLEAHLPDEDLSPTQPLPDMTGPVPAIAASIASGRDESALDRLQEAMEHLIAGLRIYRECQLSPEQITLMIVPSALRAVGLNGGTPS